MRETIKIFRYKSRRFYLSGKGYLKSDDVIDIIKMGKNVQIFSRVRGEELVDITAKVLIEFVFKVQRKAVSNDDASLLCDVIRGTHVLGWKM